ncbi:hypothetical protein KIF24_25080 [Micromonospora sp. Llam7]|uniref:hypothetical protein n=1 Tax=Micromonospora tarapacensis TaxID=2835305 RepID=UPI001C828B0D|nr:hypothetical protein [Micromonospora tarapacensis]MBX7268979.1 hypothetical protein [Micromonospora tarapacensis]
MRRTVALLGLPLMMIVAGCAPADTEPGSAASPDNRHEAFDERAAAVAEAWHPGAAWSTGYVPLQDATVLVGEPEFTDETKLAFHAGWYRRQTDLPTGQRAGTIRFPDGELRVPLITAAEAYRQLDQGDPPPCPGRPKEPGTPPPANPPDAPAAPDDPVSSEPQAACIPLTVTKVEPGTAPMHTTRGTVQVPAWLFSVAEISAVVARVAVAPHAVGAVPEPVAPTAPAPADLVGAQDIRAIDGATLTYRLGVGSCDTGITPLVREHDHVVVVGGSILRATGVACDDMLRLEPVVVQLRAPLDARPVLDVLTGAPLRLAAG